MRTEETWVPDPNALRDRIAVVAGATRGAGRGIAAALGEAGATVICTGRTTRKEGAARSDYDRPETIEETAELVTRLGGNGIAMGFDQLYNAMQTGVVDGAENNPPTYVSGNHFQVAKYFSMTEHLIIPEILVFSRRSWETLSKDDQELIKKFSKEAQLEQRKLWYEREEESVAKMKQVGIEIVTFSPAEKQRFQDAVKPVWDKYGTKYADLVKRIQAVN